MSMTKRWLEEEQDKFACETFIKDGCPEDEAKNMTWDDVITHFFDDDDELAMEAFIASKEVKNA